MGLTVRNDRPNITKVQINKETISETLVVITNIMTIDGNDTSVKNCIPKKNVITDRRILKGIVQNTLIGVRGIFTLIVVIST